MTGEILYLGMPITLMLISLSAFIFVGVEIKKRRIEIKDIVVWFVLNILFVVSILYVLIIEVLRYRHISEAINAFNWIAENAFGLDMNGQEWIILMILGFISFILAQLMINSVRVQRLQKRLDDTAKEVAILSGKVNASAKFSSNPRTREKTVKEVKSELKLKVRIAKAEKKAKDKMKTFTQTQKVKLGGKKTK